MKYVILLLNLFLATNAFAIFCPNDFNSINLGDSLSQVLITCGNPTSRNDFQETAAVPQEWLYYIRNSNLGDANTKLSVIFDVNGQVVNINIERSSQLGAVCDPLMKMATGSSFAAVNCNAMQGPSNVTSTPICGAIIRLGDTKQSVENACGKAAFVNQSQQAANNKKMTELRYDGSQSVSLIFENERLIDRRYN